ncbi:MAG: glycosyltransferase family 4 protein [Chloroflexota bacterium]|nr:glycosyltransferase family 4 protein [Chloroflexota bacterium]
MRILLISRCPPYPLHLGDRLIVYHLARELNARGHQIDLLALTDDLDDIRSRHEYADLFASVQLFPDAPRSPFSVLRRALLSSARFPRRAAAAWSPDLWTAIETHVAQQHYDVAHVFGGISVYEMAGALGTLPALITPYESYSLYLKRQRATAPPRPLSIWRAGVDARVSRMEKGLAGAVKYWLARRCEAFMFAPPPPLTPYRRIIVLSSADADELRALNPAYPLAIIPNGVDLDYFAPIAVERAPHRLLFVGNYDYAPNADAALWLAREIMPRVRERIPDATLQLVGNAPTAEMSALASERVEIVGRVPDMRPYYAGAAAFACGLRFGAGIKNKVLEALAMGCPVVATPLSADGIAAEHEHDILIAAADPDTFAAALVRALSDAELRQGLSANGRALIESRYSWGRVVQQYERLYQQTIEESS